MVDGSHLRPLAMSLMTGGTRRWYRPPPLLLVVLLAVLAMTQAQTAPRGTAVMPSFRSLPPPLIHYQPGRSQKLRCEARPITADVRIVVRGRGDTNFQALTTGSNVGVVEYTIENPDTYNDMDIHCQVKSHTLGYVLSRPVRLVKTMLQRSQTRGRYTSTASFYKGNIAQVQCNIPASQPPAEIEFLKNDDLIGELAQHQTDKYKMVRLSNSDKMVMLIKDFSRSDTGVYSCRARNPLTQETIDINRRTKLNIIETKETIKARFHVDDPFHKGSGSMKVSLMEGENATLYCLPEGAPIPTVNWYRHSSRRSLPKNSKVDSQFGTLQLFNVKVEDASEYMCAVKQTDHIITSAILVSVRKRLKIVSSPRNVKLKSYGNRAVFTCTVAGGEASGKVRPEWYHNGVYLDARNIGPQLFVETQTGSPEASGGPPTSVEHGTLTIVSVTTDLLGVYQCVARSNNEWDSASAALVMSTDSIISGEERDRQIEEEKRKQEKKRKNKKKKNRGRKNKSGRKKNRGQKNGLSPIRGGRRKPATRIEPQPPTRWRPPTDYNNGYPEPDDGGGRRRPGLMDRGGRLPLDPYTNPAGPSPVMPDADIYDKFRPPQVKTLFDNLAVELLWKYDNDPPATGFKVQYQSAQPITDYNTMRQTVDWNTAIVNTIREPFREQRCVLVKELSAGKQFRFRVNVIFASGNSVSSGWSEPADFTHVINIKPSILTLDPVGTDSLRIQWNYDRPVSAPALSNFVILARRLLDESRQTYERYTDYQVSSQYREYLISNLRPGTHYQVAMYGVVNQSEHQKRMITLFSNEVGRKTNPAPPGSGDTGSGDPVSSAGGSGSSSGSGSGGDNGAVSKNNTAESTKLMFWILGGLAGVMLLVMAFLIGLCLVRQRREKKRSRAAHHAQLNGTSLDSYKDPAKLLHRRQQAQAQAHANNQFLLSQLGGAGGPGGPNHNGTWSGPAGHHQSGAYLRGSSASVQQLHQVPGSAMNLNVVPETQSLMLDHYNQQQHHLQHPGDMTTDLGGYGPPPLPGYNNPHGHHGNGTLGSKSQLSGITSHHHHHPEHDMVGDLGYPGHTGSVGPYRPLGSGYAPFMTSGQRPSHLDVRPTPAGDAESIYSYFSQQEMGVQHCGLSDVPGGPPMPYRPQLAEAGSQTTDRQQHRHHRRRRRKQPGGIPPTGPGGPLPTALEHSVAPSPPMMRDMAVNTDLGSTGEGTYDQPASGNLQPYGYPMMVHGGGQYFPDSSGGATASSAASSTAAYQSVTPPARMASLGPHHGYQPSGVGGQGPPVSHAHHYPQQGYHPAPVQQQAAVVPHGGGMPQGGEPLGPAGPTDASTLTRRGTPTLFVDPPKMRDYSEYAIPETKA